MTPPDDEQRLAKSNAAADEQFGSQPADGTTVTCADTTWIDIELVGDDEKPVPHARFQIFRPDRTLLGEGRLDENGCGGFERIDDGEYEVCFPDLDREAWEPA